MKIVKGEVNQVQISNVVETEGAKDNQKQVTYHVHKFMLNGTMYTFKKAGAALNISNGNEISLAVGVLGGVSKIYNHSSNEFSHHNPAVTVYRFALIMAFVLFGWHLAASKLFYKFAPTDFHNLPILTLVIVICLGAYQVVRNFQIYSKLKTK
ncbi:hypothetical protein [uncultured Psychrosphaera sp.]|uniref:hypothetical protein n=1 Tax=uncultured Psychrosphaera sp. TaxID=1403522 RepID=UPI00260EFA99|nr:hypothetical protein [uncultured Psychrosphaera sp.]